LGQRERKTQETKLKEKEGLLIMPIVSIRISRGRTVEQKRAMVQSVTQAIVSAIDVRPEWVTVIIEEFERENWATGGVLHIDKYGPGFGKKGNNQLKESVKQQNPSDEFYTREKCHITELSNTPDDRDASIARARVEPGVTTRWHRLKGTVERYYIISGKGLVEVGELPPQKVNAGDIVLIPPMCPQRITNIGSEDLIFLAICTPRFSNDAYEDIEERPT